MYSCMRNYSDFLTARCVASTVNKSISGLIWLGMMSEGGNVGSDGSAVSVDLNHPVNKNLPSGISPRKIRMDMELMTINNDTHRDSSFIVLKGLKIPHTWPYLFLLSM